MGENFKHEFYGFKKPCFLTYNIKDTLFEIERFHRRFATFFTIRLGGALLYLLQIKTMLDALFIVLGLVALILGGNWLLKAAVALSLRLQIPKIVIGMTVVSFATSAPELIVSIKAALDGFPDLSLGNVIGSNIANLDWCSVLPFC